MCEEKLKRFTYWECKEATKDWDEPNSHNIKKEK